MQRIWTQSDGERDAAYVAGTEVRVATVLAMLEQGRTFQDIRQFHYPDLTNADIRACVLYARRRPGADAVPIDYDPSMRAECAPGFWFEFGVPLFITALMAALLVVYFHASNAVTVVGLQAGAAKTPAILAPAQLALPFKDQGDAAYASGQYSEAETWYRKALDIDGANAAVCLNLGLTYFRESCYDDAEGQYRRAAALDLAGPTAHYDLGLLLSARGRPSGALKEFTQALSLKPEDADFHYSLGKVYCDLDRFADAVPEFEHALRIEPTHRLAQQSLRYARKLVLLTGATRTGR